MYTIEELYHCLETKWFIESYNELERILLRNRLGQDLEEFDQKAQNSLSLFTSASLGSASCWDDTHNNMAIEICSKAADIEAGLAYIHMQRPKMFHSHVLRAAILYELAGMPGTSATFVKKNGLDSSIKSFFSREGKSFWGKLQEKVDYDIFAKENFPYPSSELKTLNLIDLFEAALGDILLKYGTDYQQGDITQSAINSIDNLVKISNLYDFGLSADETSAVKKILENRIQNSSLKHLKEHSHLKSEQIRKIGTPSEFWPVQAEAISKGLLELEKKSYGLAAPTGTGKTSLSKILIADFLKKAKNSKIIYIAPSKALVAQISKDLTESLGAINIKVLSLGSYLTIHGQLAPLPDDYDVLIFTPERADLLMRVDEDFMSSVGLVIVDEAHHIEQEGRGILLELYLWRLKKILPKESKIVQLSAVAPNISEMTSWLAEPNNTSATKFDWRTNRLRLGLFELTSSGSGIVKFEKQLPFELFKNGEFPSDSDEGLAKLADKLSYNGIVLVLATSPARAETLANIISEQREKANPPKEQNDFSSERLDAWAERELHTNAKLRKNYKNRVVYHHARIPPRVRFAIEDVISKKKVDIVCATTTLAEGVNFPFSTVIVESLVAKNYEISPRSLWNIAGRAGRFGVDSEGHCILYRPQLWSEKLSNFKLEDYLSTELDKIPPVRSALANSLIKLDSFINKSGFNIEELEKIDLSSIDKAEEHNKKVIKDIRELTNLIRVGYTHAQFSKIIDENIEQAEEFENQFFASNQLSPENKVFAKKIAIQQKKVVSEAFKKDPEYLRIAAKIGWSLEVQNNINAWISSRENWQLEQFGKFVIQGHLINADKLSYLIGPISKKMAEFGGDALGGFTSYIATEWIKGVPLSDAINTVNSQRTSEIDFGEIVRIIYGKIQYMLPWALFGVNELLQYEAKKRNITVLDGVSALSALAAEGVSSFDALRLVTELNIERVDATRLAKSFKRSKSDTDIISWFKNNEWNTVVGIVKGSDRRRLDPELRKIWQTQRG